MARLGRKLYPRVFREGWRSIRQDLEEAETDECNLSIGLFDNRRLAGYVLGYVVEKADLSALPDIEEISDAQVIYIDDLAVDTDYRRHTHELIYRFARYCRRDFPEHVVVAHGLRNRMHRMITRHKDTSERFGYRLASLQDIPGAEGKREQYLVQWRPIPGEERRALAAPNGAPGRQRSYDVGGQTYTVELIESEQDWWALEPVWDGLLHRTPEATVFQTFDYLQIWWRRFGLFHELFILVIRCEGEIIGIAPLQLTRVQILGHPFRELGFIGSRWEVDRPTFLFPAKPRECCDAVLCFLVEHKDEWDLCEFYEQAAGGTLMQYLRTGFKENGYLLGVTEDSVSPYLRFEGTWGEFLSAKSRKFRKNLKAARRKLEGLGRLEYRTYEDGGDIEAQLERYAALEDRSWKADEKVGCNRSAHYFQFYRDLVAAFGRSNALHVRFLTLDGEPIAGTFGLLHQGKYYSLHIVYDRAYGKYSPGTLLETLELEECFNAGHKEYDFLGGFLNNKSRWTDQARRTTGLHVFRATPRLYLVYCAYFVLKPRVKQLLRRLGVMSHLIRLQSWLEAQRQRWRQSKGHTAAEEGKSHAF